MCLKLVLPMLVLFAQAAFSASTITFDVSTCVDGESLLIIQGATLQWHNLSFEHPDPPDCPTPTLISTTLDGAPVLTKFLFAPTWTALRGDLFSSVVTDLSPALAPPPGSSAINVSLSVIQVIESLTISQLPTQANNYTLILDFNDSVHGGTALNEAKVTITYDGVTTAPVLTPKPGIYGSTMLIAMADADPDATVYYTLDGSLPTTASTKYTVPIPVPWGATIKANAVAASTGTSFLVTGTYTIDRPMQVPTFSLPGGTYAAPLTIALSDNPSYCSHAICNIYYTLNGSNPNTSSIKYTGPISLDTAGTITVKAIATSHHFTPSPVASATYTIQ